MRIERLILLTFLGNYLINNFVAAIIALFPLAGHTYVQYTVYFVLAAIVAGIITWWYFKGMSKSDALRQGAIFGVGAFIVAIVTALVSGICGVLAQTGSFSKLMEVLPNFGPFLWNISTLALLGYWVVPGVLVGWWLQSGGSFKMPMKSSSGGMHAVPSHDSSSM